MTAEAVEIRGAIMLPAVREDVEFVTDDGKRLVGELAVPVDGRIAATLITLHPLPVGGGFMDSHILRKAAARLPALAGIAVLRFNFRGTTSPRGTSQGEYSHGTLEGHDLEAALRFAESRGLPNRWLLGWSFGTEVLLKHGLVAARAGRIEGAILLSPPLKRVTDAELAAWAGCGIPVVALVPELDDYLRPTEARARFAAVPEAEVIGVDGAKHLWVGEEQTYRVLGEIVERLDPAAAPLPRTWSGPLA